MHAALALSQRAIDEVRALSRQEGPRGPKGDAGKDGRLPVVKEWQSRVHYAGDVVRHNGSTYQALEDTGAEPPGDNWGELAGRGMDGRGFTVRGTYNAATEYRMNDIVMIGSSSFVAKADSPGELPGDGWQLWAGAGKRGKEGPPGPKGERGESEAPIIRVDVDPDNMSIRLVKKSGEIISVDLSPIAERILEAAR